MKKSLFFPSLCVFLACSDQTLALTATQINALQAELSNSKSERKTSATAGYSQLIGFVSDPVVSGYTLRVDDKQGSSMAIFKLPFRNEMHSIGKEKLFIRGSFNYATVETENLLEDVSIDKVEPWSKAYSGLVGALFTFPLKEGWRFTPAIDMGLARIENDVHFAGADAFQVKPIVENLLINWSTDAALMSGTLGLDYHGSINAMVLDVKTSLIHSWISSYHESDDFSGFNEQTDMLHIRADFTNLWRTKLDDMPLSGVLHLGNTIFIGSNRHALGFSYLNAIGYAIKADTHERKWSINSLTLGFNYLMSDTVNGYEIVFGYQF